MLIQRQALADFREREFDDFTWVKSLTRDQLWNEMRRWRRRPEFITEPWVHQMACLMIGRTLGEFVFHLDMGLGKTRLGADLTTQHQREKDIQRMLVGVPRAINVSGWGEDIPKHSRLAAGLVDMSDIEEKWRRLSQPDSADLMVIDYQSLHWALSERRGGRGKGKRELMPNEGRIRVVQKLYQGLMLDESHKLGNHQSLWFALLRRLSAAATVRYAFTGTMWGKNPEMVWPQFFLVDRGKTFGENLGLFRGTFFRAEPNRWGRGEKFTYKPETEQLLGKMLRNRSIRYEDREVHDLPPVVKRVETFVMTDEQRYQYMLAMEGLINAGGDLEQMDGEWTRMRRILSGYLKWKDEYGEHVKRFAVNPKLEGLMAKLDRLIGDGGKAVVAYDYTETGSMIHDALAAEKIEHEWFYGGTPDKAASKRRFIDRPSNKVFLMNSEAGGTGTDGLQEVASYLFFYETPTPPITRRQTEKRIDRPGKKGRSFLYDLVMQNSLDGGILRDLAESRDSFESIVKGGRKVKKSYFLTET